MAFVKKINVLVVDDSAFMRKIISDFLSSDNRIEVIDTARNGEDALKKIKGNPPDVVTLDVEMPIMNGLDTLREIMGSHPLPVVMLSSTTHEGAENTLTAIEFGAVDFIEKPSGAISLDLYKVRDELIEKVINASEANLTKLRPKQDRVKEEGLRYQNKRGHVQDAVSPAHVNKKKLICIGTSTGGPKALQEVLVNIPKRINAPILIVQHMPRGFTKSLASRLNSICDIQVKEAEHGEILQNGVAYIAPGGFHMKIKKLGSALTIHIDQSMTRNGHRPSVDVLFESVNEISGYEKIAVIMTGMGTDGSHVLSTMKATGDVKIIAESQDSCIVYGMPKAAVATNSVDVIVGLEQISEMIMKYVKE